MNIPDEAVEAAAKAFYGPAYSDVADADLEYAIDQVRAMLEAAAPYILDKAAETRLMAMVWTEAYQAGFQEGAGFELTPNPYRSQA